ncbi:MAG: helix-turn-helix domain-containing protein [Gemmatimonadota bacterium]
MYEDDDATNLLPDPVEAVADTHRAAVLLAHPLRRDILAAFDAPQGIAAVADRLGHSRQKVHYHVKQLADADFLRRAGTVRKRALTEQWWVATARSYVLAPEVLGPLALHTDLAPHYAMSAAHLLALAARTQAEVARAADQAEEQGIRLRTLAMHSELRFASAEQRAAFAAALTEAVAEVVARHTEPARKPDGTPAPGWPYRMTLGVYPLPAKPGESHE